MTLLKKKEKEIFICTGNSCRSQMAEGFLKTFPNNNYDVYSAGGHPSKVHPNAIAVMKEFDIDISGHTSDSIDSYINIGIDIVITVCDNAKQVCPVFSSELNRLHWSIEDPLIGWNTNSIQLNNFRKVRDKIKNYVKNFINNRE